MIRTLRRAVAIVFLSLVSFVPQESSAATVPAISSIAPLFEFNYQVDFDDFGNLYYPFSVKFDNKTLPGLYNFRFNVTNISPKRISVGAWYNCIHCKDAFDSVDRGFFGGYMNRKFFVEPGNSLLYSFKVLNPGADYLGRESHLKLALASTPIPNAAIFLLSGLFSLGAFARVFKTRRKV